MSDTLTIILAVLAGASIGACVGTVVAALCFASRDDRRRSEGWQ